MTHQQFEQRLKKIKDQEKKYGVEIEISDIIDKDHLDCVWYGGEVGTIKYKGYTVVIAAYGDIRIDAVINGEPFDIKDKNNGGVVYEEIGNLIDDAKLAELENADLTGDYIRYENNNWFEFDIIDPDGKYIDCCYMDNVINDDLIECFSEADFYIGIIEQYKKENEK